MPDKKLTRRVWRKKPEKTAVARTHKTVTQLAQQGDVPLVDAMAVIDENQRLRELVNGEPVTTAANALMVFYMVVIRGMDERHAIATADRVVAIARRVRG